MRIVSGMALVLIFCAAVCAAQSAPEKIIIDTDIGDDVDDAFAVALALKSPEVEILGITTTFGDTEARAKLVDRMLGEAGGTENPGGGGEGAPTKGDLTERRHEEGGR